MTSFIAKFLSGLLCYPLIAFFEMVFLCYIYGVNLQVALIGFFLHVIGPIIAPILYGKFVVKGDFFVSNREHRPLLFIPGVISYFFAAYLFNSLQFIVIFALELTSMVSSIALMLFSLYWKISVHMVSITIPIVFFLIFGFPQVLLFSPLILIIGWGRVKVGAHSVYEVLGGFILGLTSTLLTTFLLRLFGYIV